MKLQHIATIATLALAFTSAYAGTEYTFKSKDIVLQPEKAAFAISMFGTYRHKLSEEVGGDDFGAGISLTNPVNYLPLAMEFGYDWRDEDGTNVHTATAGIKLRLIELDNLSIYGITGGAYQFNGHDEGWGVDGGLGVEYDFGGGWSAFTDYRYRYNFKDGIGDTGGVRLGLSKAF